MNNTSTHSESHLAPVLRAKLVPPAADCDQVPRPRLVAGLQQGLSRRMTLVSGPPGYGKTTTVAQWLRQVDRPVAWLTLDPFDNDLMTFTRGLTAAIERAYADAGKRTRMLLIQPQGAPASVFADALIEDLADLPGPLVLTIDEYHVITNGNIQTLTARLLQFLPSNVHLVLISRHDPNLPLSLLRGRGELNELHADDLQFNAAEIQRFLSLSIGFEVDAAAAGKFARLTEGWPNAIQLALLARQTGESIGDLADRLVREGHGYIADFLTDEVLAQQTDEVQRFLLQTSILDELTESLCAALLSDDPARPRLRTLHQARLPLTPIDERFEWFRYHPLFQELLQQRLATAVSAQTRQALHRRASDWFAAAGEIDDAIIHALAGDNPAAAARLVEDNVHAALNREEMWRVSRWLKMLPDDTRRRPKLLIAQAWLHVLELRIEAVARLLNELTGALATSDLPPDEIAQIQGQIDLINAIALYQTGDAARAVAIGDRGMDAVPPQMDFVRSMAGIYLILAAYAHEGQAAAEAYIDKMLGIGSVASTMMSARMLIARGFMGLELGDVDLVQRVGTMLNKAAIRSNMALSTGWAGYAHGYVAYEWNDLPLAEKELRRAVDEPYRLHGRAVIESFVLLALTRAAQGRTAEAEETADDLREFVVESDSLHFMPIVEALECRLAPERLMAMTATLPPPPDAAAARRDLLLSLVISPTLTRVRGLLLRPTPERLANAAAILSVIRQAANTLRATRRLVEILALEALVHDAFGREAAALDSLRQALELAEGGRLIRTVIDCGPGLRPLLERLAAGESSAAVERLLGAPTGLDPAEAKRRAAAMADLRSILTTREMQVLQMLARRLSNKEIATALVVAPDSVRRYTTRIYRKLGVRSRRAAVSQAEALGLLTSE